MTSESDSGSAIAAKNLQTLNQTGADNSLVTDKKAAHVVKPFSIAINLMAIVICIGALKLGEAFFVPLVCGIFLAYAMAPIVRYLEKFYLPRSLAAGLTLIAFLMVLSTIGFTIWNQGLSMVEKLPHAMEQVKKTMKNAKSDQSSAIAKIEAAKAAVQVVISEPNNTPSKTGPISTPQKEPSRSKAAQTSSNEAPNSDSLASIVLNSTSSAIQMAGTLATVCLLALFFTISKTQIRAKAVRFFEGKYSDGRLTESVLDQIDASIQRYLLALFATNLLLGFVTFAGLWFLNFNDAAVWGVLAGIFHFVPYVGPLGTAVGTFLTGLSQWENFSQPSLAAGLSVLIAFIIGNFAQTWAIGKVAKMNSTVVFVSLLFFGWLWGAVGLLIAVPIMVVVKVISDNQPPPC